MFQFLSFRLIVNKFHFIVQPSKKLTTQKLLINCDCTEYDQLINVWTVNTFSSCSLRIFSASWTSSMHSIKHKTVSMLGRERSSIKWFGFLIDRSFIVLSSFWESQTLCQKSRTNPVSFVLLSSTFQLPFKAVHDLRSEKIHKTRGPLKHANESVNYGARARKPVGI